MRLILVRHGETAHNRDNITLGRADVPLNERGRAQARAIAASFTRPPDAVYASPLARARATAGAISAATGVAAVDEPALIEMDVGEMEHLSGAELRERHPDFLRAWMSGDPADVRMPGGESLRDVQERTWACIERLASGHGGATVVAVTHNFVISMVACRAVGLPIAGFRSLRAAVASKSVIDLREGRNALVRFNDVAHLLGAGLADDQFDREARP
jgi:broad specificity phosphatase PhoE